MSRKTTRQLLVAMIAGEGSTAQLADRAGLTVSHTGWLLRQLVRGGLVNRRRDDRDFRYTHYSLSEAGRELAAAPCE